MSTLVHDYMLAMLAAPLDAADHPVPTDHRTWTAGLRGWLDQARRLDEGFGFTELEHRAGEQWWLARVVRPLSATIAFCALTDGIDGFAQVPVKCDLLVLLAWPDGWSPSAEEELAQRAADAGYGGRCLVLEPRWAAAVLRGTDDGPLFWGAAARERDPSVLDTALPEPGPTFLDTAG